MTQQGLLFPLKQDFSEAEHAHHSFLHALMTQSFLLQGSMIGLFGQVFSHINTLCRLVKGAREQGLDWEAVKVQCGALIQTVCSFSL